MPDNERETVLSQLLRLNKISTALTQFETIEEVVQTALREVINELNVQVASIFLFNKDGMVERVGINGVDKDGKLIDNNWFPEKYKSGESFTGKVVPPFDSESGYGEPKYSNDLGNPDEYKRTVYQEGVNQTSIDEYNKKLGGIKSVISVPLNGAYHTFGVLEVINKMPKQDNETHDKFTDNDLSLLMLIGAGIANILVDLRRVEHRQIYNDLIDKVIKLQAYDKELRLNDIYDLVATKVIEKSTTYKVCIIRIAKENGVNKELEIVGKAYTEDINWEYRNDDAVEPGSQVVGEVYKMKEHWYIEDIEPELDRYKNQEWIRNNNLKSHACFPLIVKDACVGTISVLTNYRRKFYNDDQNFLKTIAFLTAAITLIKDLRKLNEQLQEEQDKFLNFSRQVAYDSTMQYFLHQYKNELIYFNLNLQKLLSDSNTSKKDKDQIIHEQMDWIKKRFEEIQSEFSSNSDNDSLTPVEINKLIKKSIRNILFNDDEDIKISVNPGKIPIIEVNEPKIQEIIVNLINNSIVAVKKNNKKDRKIVIATDIIKLEIPYIQIIIEDNGIGISNENKDKVFHRGFTTRRDEGGTGMGLFITRTIIKEYGGKIHFESTVGKGTTFFVHIPLMRHQYRE